MTGAQVRVLDMVRERVAVAGVAPSIREIAAWEKVGVARAHVLVRALVDGGWLVRGPGRVRNLRPAELPDLRAVPTDALAAELARRGVTRGALSDRPARGHAYARTCAADSCDAAVRRGHLMCREHWFALPRSLRERILATFGRGDERAFGKAVAQARDLIDCGGAR